MDLYSENILDHYKNPLNFGTLENATVSVIEYNPLCGDKIQLDLIVKDNIIQQLAFSGNGCAISQAAMSMLSEKLAGTTLEEANKITNDDIYEMLGVPISPARVKCALLGICALRRATKETSTP